jgi:hypothetical protein
VSARARRRALVIVRHGPASERGWLALRTALAFGLGGFDVDVWLEERAVALAAASLDVRAWLGGDPGDDLGGLLDDLGARVHVPLQWAAISEAAHGERPGGLREGISLTDTAELPRLYERADVVVRP